ncbi:response regulator [Parabacteroides sp. OttesenSCG-928-K15]|nr:response regulator [Parabacteroides sp. OttesenSCG-928-K15]
MKKSILLVDDKPEIAKIITLYLSGYEVKYVENPLIAIAWLTSGNIPDLIVSDINMPEMTGEEFLVYLKDNEMFKRIPVFILSSVDDSDTRIRLYETGAADFILKPFNPEELKIRISRALSLSAEL